MFSRDLDEQVNQLDKVLSQLWSAGLKLKGSKHLLFTMKVSSLGYTLLEERILPDPENLAKILNWQLPNMMHEVSGIL